MSEKNRLAIAVMLGLLVAGAVYVTRANHAALSPIASVERSIGGTGELSPAPDTYLTLCLPSDWKTNATCQQLLADTAKPNFAKLRKVADTKIYVDGQPDFEHRFQSGNNTGPIKTLPCVLVQHKGHTDKWSGERTLRAEVELDMCLKKILCHPKPDPEPEKPTPKPEEPKTDVPELPDVTPPEETPLAPDDTLGVLLSAIAGGVVSWFVMFTRKT